MYQNFQSYPKYGVDGAQDQNYDAGGSKARSSSSALTQQPIKSSDTLTKTAGPSVPGTTIGGASPATGAVRPAPGVATQAPSPAVTQVPQSNFQRMAAAARQVATSQPKTTVHLDPKTKRPGESVWQWMARMRQERAAAEQPKPNMDPAPAPTTPPVAVDPGTAAGGAPPTPAGPGQSGGPIPMQQLGALIEQLLGAPSQYADEGYQKTYDSLTSKLREDIDADAARRGLDYTSVPTDIYGREAGKIATNLSADAAQQYHQNLLDALGLASGFGQQAFDNQMATINALANLGNYANDPMGEANDGDWDWSGAWGEQGAGEAELSQYLMSMLPYLGGGYPGTPPFQPGNQTQSGGR